MAFATYRLASAQGWILADGVADILRLLGQDPSQDSSNDLSRGVLNKDEKELSPSAISSSQAALPGWEDLGDKWAADDDAAFFLKLIAVSIVSALFVKYFPALIPREIETAYLQSGLALNLTAIALVVVPTVLNCLKWHQRSKFALLEETKMNSKVSPLPPLI
eukprot:CAMPEP_0197302154 /NCGR_PEP_ID=MMETSP0890-20130614/50866_1 /TAXON_ID=44058 ORGANISM="Aureoumbra lagunensis, Strain CCMP1510" /NCGR_SAMPLE_ID=MMETSP0890 /ASSEMBLY_ACC=CAM_ASM_000533 /LENGTH=162 /DNA_ID=CAMNT_0042781671 /DNA_START=1103 /DNA_END=1591 /DNA_ORIENTATION=-